MADTVNARGGKAQLAVGEPGPAFHIERCIGCPVSLGGEHTDCTAFALGRCRFTSDVAKQADHHRAIKAAGIALDKEETREADWHNYYCAVNGEVADSLLARWYIVRWETRLAEGR